MAVFDPQQALQHLNGRRFAYSNLREELKKIRFEHIQDLSPEFDINELLHLALRSHWLEETADGQYIVRVR
jgi:hypothetical protein